MGSMKLYQCWRVVYVVLKALRVRNTELLKPRSDKLSQREAATLLIFPMILMSP